MRELARDSNDNVAYSALETFVDYSNNQQALRDIVSSATVNIDLRLRAGNALRERGRLDPAMTAVLEQLEAERYGHVD